MKHEAFAMGFWCSNRGMGSRIDQKDAAAFVFASVGKRCLWRVPSHGGESAYTRPWCRLQPQAAAFALGVLGEGASDKKGRRNPEPRQA